MAVCLLPAESARPPATDKHHSFLGKKTIGPCYGKRPELPTFHFLATNFFSRTLFEQVDRSVDKSCPTHRTGVRHGVSTSVLFVDLLRPTRRIAVAGLVSPKCRASDILMRRIAETTLQNRLRIASAGLALVRIGQTFPDPNLAETMQQRFRLIPPDLDQFNQRLATVLIEHRERIGRAALCKHHLEDSEPDLLPLLRQDRAAGLSAPPQTDQ